MNEKQAKGPGKRHGLWMAVAVAASLIVLALFAWWTAARAEREMRDALLQQTRLVAKVADIERVQAFTGKGEDLNRLGYLRLKQQFAAVCSANPQCRFIYLLGRKPDGRVFIVDDDDLVGRVGDEVRAGQVYDNVPDGIRRVFDTGKADTAGPFTDRWGTFVSGAVPVVDPATGAVAAVLAMDIDAASWNWEITVRSALPVGLMLVLLVSLVTALAVTRRVDASPKPVLRRLLPPLAGMVALLVAGAGALLWEQHQLQLSKAVKNRASEVSGDLGATLLQQSSGLAAALETITADAKVQKALRRGDADRLLADWRPVYDTMHKGYHLTHFYFFDKNRVCLLRVHRPEKRGGTINHFTALEAERTGNTASGIELGSQGNFTLRVVRPVFDGGTLAGYVELGKEIEDVMRELHVRSGSQIAVVIHKDQLERRAWEDGMKFLGREADWNRLPRNVVVYSSQGRLPDAFAPVADHDAQARHELDRTIRFDGKDWRGFATPLRDASGKEVGSLLVMSDITAEDAAFAQLLVLGGVSGGVLLVVLLGIILVLLRRTDAGILAQHEELREREAFQNMLLATIPIPVFYKDRDGRYLGFNKAFETLFGRSREEMIGRNVFDLNPPELAKTYQAEDDKLFENAGVRIYESQVVDAHGVLHDVVFHKAAITDSQGSVTCLIGATLDITERKRSEEALAEEAIRRRILVEQSRDGIVVLDLQGKVYEANRKFAEMLGYSPEEVLQLHVWDWNDGLPREQLLDMIQAVDETGDHFETTHRRKDGTYFETEISSNGALCGGRKLAFCVCRDITKRRHAEQVLAETKREFEHIFANSYVGIMLMRDGRIIGRCNNRMSEIFGYDSPGEMVGLNTRCLHLDEERYKEFGERYFPKILQAEQFQAEYQLRRKDGSPVWCLLSGKSVDPSNPDHGVIWVIDDIGERKRAEEVLHESEARLRGITDSAQDAILMIDPEGLISFWNPAAERILGYKDSEAIGRNLHALIVPTRYLEAHRAAFPGFLRTGHGDAVGKTLDLEARRKDGKEISVQLSLSAIHIHGAWHAVGILRDITERKRAEAELLETNRYLEATTARANQLAAEAGQATIAKSEFLANMSHEIRTPMNGVIGMTGLLLDTELTDEQRRYARIVRTSGESLLGLINDILDFSKIEAKKLDLEALDFDLTSLLEDFASTLAVRAQEKGIELLCAADPRVPTLLRGDPGRIRQVLNNLAGNAVKFTSTGEVAVRVSISDEDEADVLLRFSVRDTGIGIPEEKTGMVFDKFSQVDASTTRKYGGTGLGLAISKQLVELMGGEIGVESEEGKGSEFWFTARLGRQPGSAWAAGIPPADLAGVRALVVDDNATNREILTTRLASWGMRPSMAQDGPEALQALHRALEANDPFRIAVIDMQMPDMDGKTLGRAIKADEGLADIRMVMLTSLGMRGDARLFQEIGFAAYVTKPVRQQELKGVLSLALTERDATEPMPRPIATRHMARETQNLFSGRTARILLAEDNITNQQVAQGILKRLGLSADAVANGAEAVRALETIPYDLVLMDVQMPVMDGLKAAGMIRDPLSAVLNHRIPIIAMTAHAMRGDREKCLEAGMNDYVSKPVSPHSLAEVLEKWLPGEADDATMQAQGMPEETDPVPGKGEDAPVFDRAGMMTRLMDDEELARTVVEGFLADIPRQIGMLRGYLEAGDAPGGERQAHSIKGASANVGGERMREVAVEIEKAARGGDLDAVRARMARLETEFDRLKREMSKHL